MSARQLSKAKEYVELDEQLNEQLNLKVFLSFFLLEKGIKIKNKNNNNNKTKKTAGRITKCITKSKPNRSRNHIKLWQTQKYSKVT